MSMCTSSHIDMFIHLGRLANLDDVCSLGSCLLWSISALSDFYRDFPISRWFLPAGGVTAQRAKEVVGARVSLSDVSGRRIQVYRRLSCYTEPHQNILYVEENVE